MNLMDKLNVKSALLLLALILCVSGVIMIYLQVRDTGVTSRHHS